MKRVTRFIEIDLNYIKVGGPTILNIQNVLITDFSIFLNMLMKVIFNKKKKFIPAFYNAKKIYYDTPFATKTFLSAEYDFYNETCGLDIFSKSPVVVDVGANIGQFLFAVKSFLPLAEVYSFEPDREIYKLLKKNARDMKKVHTYNLALGDSHGKTEFYVNKEFSEWSSLFLNPSFRYKRTIVDIDKGDRVFKDINTIDLLKIDVEGAETEVIRGMEKTLSKVKYLLIEISLARNEQDLGSSSLIRFLFSKGFYIHNVGRIFSEGLGKNQQAVDILFKKTSKDLRGRYV